MGGSGAHTGAGLLSSFGVAGLAGAGGVGEGVGEGWTAGADGALEVDDAVVE